MSPVGTFGTSRRNQRVDHSTPQGANGIVLPSLCLAECIAWRAVDSGGPRLSGRRQRSPRCRRRAETALSVLDSQLAHRNYLCATEPTLADLFCYGDIAFAELCAFDLHRWTNVVAWTERVTALTGFKAPFALLAMENAEL
jgi:glutathione S-transferase